MEPLDADWIDLARAVGWILIVILFGLQGGAR